MNDKPNIGIKISFLDAKLPSISFRENQVIFVGIAYKSNLLLIHTLEDSFVYNWNHVVEFVMTSEIFNEKFSDSAKDWKRDSQ